MGRFITVIIKGLIAEILFCRAFGREGVQRASGGFHPHLLGRHQGSDVKSGKTVLGQSSGQVE